MNCYRYSFLYVLLLHTLFWRIRMLFLFYQDPVLYIIEPLLSFIIHASTASI